MASDDKMNLELGLNVTSTGTEKLTDVEQTAARIKASFDRLNKSATQLKNNFQSLGKGKDSETKGAKDALDIDRERYRVLKMQMGYKARELRNAQREELRGIREAERAQAQADRRSLAAARELTRERERGLRQIERGLGRAGGGARRVAGVAAVQSAAAAYATQRTVDTLTRSALTIDEAITQAQIHVFGEQNTGTSRKSAEALRKKLMPVASKLGTKTADLMGAYVEAAQAGISDDLLDTAVEQGTKYARMNKLNVPDVLEQSGYAIQGLKSFGKVTAATLKSYFDETSYIIATTSANRQELLAATKTGMAAGASVGMSRQETIAVLGSIVGVGGEGGQASRMLSTQGSRVANWRNKGRDILQKHHRSAEDRQFLDAVQILGYLDSDAMADAFSKDFFGSLVNAQDKIKGISDPLKRKSITAQLFGKEFGALLDSVIMGGQLKEYRDKLNNASGFLNHNWDKFTGNLGFLLDKIGVVFSNITETMGLALKPIWQEVSEWIDRFKGFDRAGEAVTNFTNGLLAGFGASSVTDLLTKIFGDPSKFTLDMRSVFLAGKGFAEGIRAVATGVRNLFSAFTGRDADAQAIGKLAGEIIALGGALTILAPALVTLASLTAIIRGLASAAGGAAALVGGGAAAGTAAGSAGGAVSGAAGGAAAGGIFAVLKRFIPAFAMPLTMDASKADRDKLTKRLGDWADRQAGKDGRWSDVGPSKRLEEMRKGLERNTEAVKKNTEATKDDVKQAAEAKAKELQAAEQKRLNDLVSVRHPAMTGSIGGGSSTVDELRQRGFLPSTPNTTPNGAGGNMPQADAGGTRTGGTRSWRNRNPGNLKDGPFARKMGATGRDDKGFAIFPDENTGRKAQEALLFNSDRYRNLSIRDAIARYAPASDGNDPASYAAAMAKAAGVGVDTPLSQLTPEQRSKFLDAQRDREGWKAGTTTGGGSVSGPLTTDGPVRANLMHGQYGQPGQNLGRLVAGNGRSALVNNAALPAFQGFIKELEAQGYHIQTLGGYNNRNIRGGTRLSQHAYGNAIDINQGKNQLGSSITDMPGNVRALAKKYGLIWGMDWKGRKDPMHFEWNGTKPWEAQQAQGGAPTAPAPGPLSMPLPPSRPNDITGNVPQGGRRGGGAAGGGSITVHIGSVSGHDADEVARKVGEHVNRAAMNGAMHDVDGGGFA